MDLQVFESGMEIETLHACSGYSTTGRYGFKPWVNALVQAGFFVGVLEMLAPDRLDGWPWMVGCVVDGHRDARALAHRSISPQAGVDWIGVRFTSHQSREGF